MPRPLIFSNGRLFVGIDERYAIRDLFYPQVGLYNHLSGHAIRMGVWVDGAISWVDEDGWDRELAYETGTRMSVVRLGHPAFGVEFECREAVDDRLDVFVRQVRFRKTYGTERHAKLFFTHDLRLAESDIGDTSFYHPLLSGVVHYKGPHWVLFGGEGPQGGPDQFACGLKGFGGFEGTWRDADDGLLSMNPIAQGSVDSTMGFDLGRTDKAELAWWAVCGRSLEEIETAEASLQSVRAYTWLPSPPAPLPEGEGGRGAPSYSPLPWGEKDLLAADKVASKELSDRLAGLPDEVLRLCERSLFIVEAHADRGGAILAALDSDIMQTNRANYAYCWPRDGAHISMVLDRLGRHEIPKRFFRFCASLISKRRPMLLQKYRSDGTLGATWHPWIADGEPEVPFQEDESASILRALGYHIRATGDRELLEELFVPFVAPTAEFLEGHRDRKTGLPLPSYDLWEERRGVHAYTCGSVHAGLVAAAKMAEIVQDPRCGEWRRAAEEARAGFLEHFVFEGGLLRRLGDETPDAANLCLPQFGIVSADDAFVSAEMTRLRQSLWVETGVGGMGRYEGDYYFRVSDELPGNPWIITTMWLAQCLIARAKSKEALDEPLELLRWAEARASSTQVLPEQVHPYTGAPLSVSPLSWSHAEVLKTALDWCEKKRSL